MIYLFLLVLRVIITHNGFGSAAACSPAACFSSVATFVLPSQTNLYFHRASYRRIKCKAPKEDGSITVVKISKVIRVMPGTVNVPHTFRLGSFLQLFLLFLALLSLTFLLFLDLLPQTCEDRLQDDGVFIYLLTRGKQLCFTYIYI